MEHRPVGDQSETEGEARWWNEVYEGETVPPWDTGHPQPALVDAIESYGLAGPVLDVGCGTGTHALWASPRYPSLIDSRSVSNSK